MNTIFFKGFEACVHGFRALGLRPRPGMTVLQFELKPCLRVSRCNPCWYSAVDSLLISANVANRINLKLQIAGSERPPRPE
jgi:hypothetical protein